MPINKKYPLDALLESCRKFPLPPRRRIMMEYILIKDLNDSPTQARKLIKRLHGIRCKINLLPYNENPALPFKRPDKQTVENFRSILMNAGYTTLVRESRGADISAACGQLATLQQRSDNSIGEESCQA